MLSDNSIVYILYTLFLIIIIPIFLRICASTFTGGDVEAKVQYKILYKMQHIMSS